MVDLRLASGDRWSFPYSMLLWVQWSRLEGFVMRYSTHTVVVRGRNLEAIYDGLIEHRLEYLQAELPQHDLGDEKQAFVSAIEVKSEE